MLWTMAMKDRVAGTKDNIGVVAAIQAIGQNFPNFQTNDRYGFCVIPGDRVCANPARVA
jgi:hypothetical protein